MSCAGLLSAEECSVSLKIMASGKSPGTDGLPAEFYKIFWKDVSTFSTFFNGRPKYVFLQRLSFDLTEKGINNSATKEKQTSAIFENLETNHLVKL